MKTIYCLVVLLLSSVSYAAPPNIVLILADDLGQADLSCYGSTFHQTPHMDALAKRGMKFTQAYSASPLCSPTRASILTGLAPARIGITAPNCHLPEIRLEKRLAAGGPNARVLNADSITRLKTDYITLPELLRNAGWRTGHLGKWHLGADPYSPLQHGFDSDLPHTPGPGPGGGNGYFAPWQFWKGEGQPGDHIEDRMAEEAEKFIDTNKNRPFFLNYWAFSVHSPWMAKDEYTAQAATRVDNTSPQRNALYAAMLRSLDEAVGRISAALEKNGVADNTIILLSGDNGSWHNVPRDASRNKAWAEVPVTSNAPYRSGKASNYEGGTRVPLLAVWPGNIAAGSTSDAVVQSTDFFPTLLELTGQDIANKPAFDGVSFAPALRGEAFLRDTIFCHFPHGGRGDIDGFRPATWVRRGNWKLIRFFADNEDGSDLLELYNLREDVSETKNLVTEEPVLAAELNSLITSYLADTEAVVPKRNPNYNKASAASPSMQDPLLGWKARQCQATVKGDSLQITSAADKPFLGFAAGKLEPGAKLRFRIKSNGGNGQVAWLAAPDAMDAPPPSPFSMKAGEFTDITAPVPAPSGKVGIIRLYLPVPSELDWIELESPGSKLRRWDFGVNSSRD
ncbi:MAG: sulfatase [Pirellula sp.]|jgi:arylsulfatase A-like enzyme